MRLLPALMAVMWMTGCFGGLSSKLPAQQRYVLQPKLAPPAEAGLPATVASIKVLRPIAAPGLGGEGIAVMRSGSRLDFYSNAGWAVDAPTVLQSLIIESLRRAGRFTTVESDSGPFAAQYLLSLDLEHFEADYSGDGPPTVQVAIVCSLGRRSDRSVLVSFTATSAVRADADRMQAVMSAFEQATSQALAQVAASIVPPAVH
jgi:cholesterol transport system auxiliary component